MVYSQNDTIPKISSIPPKVLFADDYLFVTLDKLFTVAGIEVINTQPSFMQIKLGKDLKIDTYIDKDSENSYLIFNGNNGLVEGTTAAQAYQLVSEMNTGTNFIRASYDADTNRIEFRYYFWIKDGFTEKSIISALEMYRITYMYAFTFDKNNLLK